MPTLRQSRFSPPAHATSAGDPTVLVLHRRKIFVVLLLCIVALLLLSLAGQIAKYELGYPPT
jgi:hypothetical protein